MCLAMKLRVIAATILYFAAVAAQNLTTFTGTYGPVFNSSCYDILQFEDAAGLNFNSLQLTQNFHHNSVLAELPTNLSGRVTLKKPFKLWEQGYNKTSDRVASFNSSFLFNIGSPWQGEGLAFIIAPNMSNPSHSFGQYLGLTTYGTDGSPGNQLVAIEFDNIKQDFDPDANHVGLNINSVISNVTASLTPLGIEIGPSNVTNVYNVWVQYDGVNMAIEVYIAQAKIVQMNEFNRFLVPIIPPQPNTPVLKSNLDLRDVLNQYSYFGFSGSTGSGTQSNTIYGWNLTVDSYLEVPPALAPAQDGKHSSWLKTLLLALGVPPIIVMAVAVIVYYCYLRKKRPRVESESNIILGTLNRLPGTPREFQFKDLIKATDNFDEKNKLGHGGFGVVYKGHLQNENLEVAVKRFSRGTLKSQDDFLAELTIINRLRHKHLVRLLGWCHKEGKLLLVYDYMPNGSLDMHLFPRTPNTKPLSWDLHYKIILGVALALHYLHNEYEQKVIHRDIKTSNIMLDSEFNARLGDFGLARALDKEKTSYTQAGGVVGTLGYIAPECFHTRKATEQSDVYAFGIVLLEIVCGLRLEATVDEFDCLIDWVWSLHQEGRILDAVEERLRGEYVIEEAKKVLVLALACSHPIASKRPKTQAIVHIISDLVPVPYLPPCQPAFAWPMPSMEEDNISNSVSTTGSRSFLMAHLGSRFTQKYISREVNGNVEFESA